MFFGKKDNSSKKPRQLDKIVKGLIIGGAVGSVIGLTIAPKSGKETRAFLMNKSQETLSKGKTLISEMENIRKEKPIGSIAKGMYALLFGKKRKK